MHPTHRSISTQINREDNVIFQQCAYFNGERLIDGWENDVSSGKSNVDSTDCSGEGATECQFQYRLPAFFTMGNIELVSITSGDYSWQGQKDTCENAGLSLARHSDLCPDDEGCSWETTTGTDNMLECEDGTLCSVVESQDGWSCCSAQCTNQSSRETFRLQPTHWLIAHRQRPRRESKVPP